MAIVNYILRKGKPLTEEERAELQTLKKIRDKDIDLSDIPEPTKEELRQFKRVNSRRKLAANNNA